MPRLRIAYVLAAIGAPVLTAATLSTAPQSERIAVSGVFLATTLDPDQKPVTSFEGTWSKVGGTGKYAGVSGQGRYQGRMLSPTDYTVEWNGEIVTQRTALRRTP